jgi:hypothetical protein
LSNLSSISSFLLSFSFLSLKLLKNLIALLFQHFLAASFTYWK